METIANFTYRHHHHHHHHHRLPLTLHHRRATISKPISSIYFKTSSSSLKMSSFSSPIKASLSNSPSQIPNPQQNLPLKTTLIVAVTAAAVFLSQLNLKHVRASTAVSVPPPPATVESESEPDPETESGYETDPEEEEKEESVPKESDTETDSGFVADPETVRNLEQQIASNPKDIESLQTLLEIKVEGKKFKEALVLLDKLLRLEPNNEELPFLKACFHFNTGNHKASKKTFHEIISKDPLRVEAYRGLIMVSSETSQDLIEAEKKIQEGLQKAKKSKKKSLEREFNVLLAGVLVLKEDYGNALRVYEDLVKEEPRDSRPYLYQGIMYAKLKKFVDAEACFEKYKRLVPNGEDFVDNIMRTAKLAAQKEEDEKQYS